jgi:hypothetical protein
MTLLQQRRIEDMTVRGWAPSPQPASLRAVRELAADDKRSPTTLSPRAMHRDLLRRHAERGLTYSPCTPIGHGLRLFYCTTLGRSVMHLTIRRAQEPSKRPSSLRRHDSRPWIAAAASLRAQTRRQAH